MFQLVSLSGLSHNRHAQKLKRPAKANWLHVLGRHSQAHADSTSAERPLGLGLGAVQICCLKNDEAQLHVLGSCLL